VRAMGHRHHVHVIGHQTPPPNHEVSVGGAALQQVQVELVVGGVEEHLLAPVASLRDVVGDSFNDDTGDARHAWKCSQQRIPLA